jgi:hypothetical protein
MNVTKSLSDNIFSFEPLVKSATARCAREAQAGLEETWTWKNSSKARDN